MAFEKPESARLLRSALDLVADGNAQPSVLIGQLGAVDPGLALAAHIHENVLGRDLDDPPLHDLATLQGRPGLLAREQRGEILGRG